MTRLNLTVGIPFYHKSDKQHLIQSIESVLGQDCMPATVHLIQDGVVSSELEEVLHQYLRDKAVKHIKLDENSGLATALNLSLRSTTTKYYARMDSDDICLPSRFLRQVEFLDNNPEVDVVGGAIIEVDDRTDHKVLREYPVKHSEIVDTLPKGAPFAHPAVMFRISSIIDSGAFYDECLRYSQDIGLWYEMRDRGFQFANLKEPVLMLRKSEDFYLRRGMAKANQEFLIYSKGILRSHGISYLLVYPFLRYVIRMLPPSLVRSIYNSSLRSKLYTK